MIPSATSRRVSALRQSWAVFGPHAGAACVVLILLMAKPAAAADLPLMEWGKPVECIEDGTGQRLRIQCTEEQGRKQCLSSSPFIKDDEGKDTAKQMDDLAYCTKVHPWSKVQELEAEGWKMIPAMAESPNGFARDESGRLFQVTFDLRRRFHMGVGWNPLFDGEEVDQGRAQFDFGWRVYELSYSKRERDNFRALEGRVALDPLEFSLLLFQYDLNVNAEEPVFWITSFIGPPTRWDVSSNLGWGIRTVKLDYHPMRSESVDFENLALYLSWDAAHNTTLSNYLRLAVGLGFGELFNQVLNAEGKKQTDTRVYLDPLAMVSGEFQLDDSGLHHLSLSVSGTSRVMFDDFADVLWTAKAMISYEWVLMAVNDQPLSLYLEASGQYREDLPGVDQKWDARGLVGARFSFWAPPLGSDY